MGDVERRNNQLVEDMYAGLNQNRSGNMGDYWFDDMVWYGPAGIGTKRGIDEFDLDYRREFIHSFPDKVGADVIRLAQGDWVAGAGYQNATFARDWLGISATGQQIKMRYMDFWRVEEREGVRKLVENHVLIDVLGVLEQAGYDVNKVLRFVGSQPPEFFEEQDKEKAGD
ncbi:MAG: ester cyclase [Anaerolineaceae bacterium]|nr:ester cyclase [Anaerolineaceae bacterium]